MNSSLEKGGVFFLSFTNIRSIGAGMMFGWHFKWKNVQRFGIFIGRRLYTLGILGVLKGDFVELGDFWTFASRRWRDLRVCYGNGLFFFFFTPLSSPSLPLYLYRVRYDQGLPHHVLYMTRAVSFVGGQAKSTVPKTQRFLYEARDIHRIRVPIIKVCGRNMPCRIGSLILSRSRKRQLLAFLADVMVGDSVGFPPVSGVNSRIGVGVTFLRFLVWSLTVG